jgi:hypothetical protein
MLSWVKEEELWSWVKIGFLSLEKEKELQTLPILLLLVLKTRIVGFLGHPKLVERPQDEERVGRSFQCLQDSEATLEPTCF